MAESQGSKLIKLEHHLIDVAPTPGLAGLEGGDDRVLRTMEVLGRVLVLRVVAAAYVPALHAEPQVDPYVAGLQAILAAIGAWGDIFDAIEMRAGIGHGRLGVYASKKATGGGKGARSR